MGIQQSVYTTAEQSAFGPGIVQAVEASTGTKGPSRVLKVLAWVGFLVQLVLSVLGVALMQANTGGSSEVLVQGAYVAAFALFGLVGSLVASRRPRNPIGWIFVVVGLLNLVWFFSAQYTEFALYTRPGSLPWVVFAAWLGTGWVAGAAWGLIATFVLLLYPSGHLLSRRWSPIAWLSGALIALNVVFSALQYGPMIVDGRDIGINNPTGVEALTSIAELFNAAGFPLLVVLAAVCVSSVVMRYRRAQGDECPQIRWFAYAAGLLLAAFGLGAVSSFLPSSLLSGLRDAMYPIAIAALPASAGIAILKYRLYDIDLLINRTLVYVPLTGVLAGLYAASIALLQKLFIATTGQQSDAAVVLTTLILTSAFTPVKNGIQGFVDRRFKEAPDRFRQLRLFDQQVRNVEEVIDVRQAVRRLLESAIAGFGANGGAVYLERDGRMDLVFASENWTDSSAAIVVPLESGGRTIGLLQLGPVDSEEPFRPQDVDRLRAVASRVSHVVSLVSTP